VSPRQTRAASLFVLTGLAVFWTGVLVVAAANDGYEHRRDYVSTLASHGSVHGRLGVLAIASAALAMIPAGLLVVPISRAAAASIALAGAGFLVVAFTRLECSQGPAGCGLGGRFAVSGGTELTHWAATTIATVLLIAGIALTGIARLRAGRTAAGTVSLAAAAITVGAFLAMGGDSPGGVQRLGIGVATGWLAALAVAGVVGRESTRQPSGG
jgi:hypothetical membrane protein